MKIKFFGQNCFSVEGKKKLAIFDAIASTGVKEADVSFNSGNFAETSEAITAKKYLSLPGEFEISEILIKGQHTDNRANTVFKIDMDEINVVHTGSLQAVPDKKFVESLGESVDVLLINVSADLDAKKLKQVIESISPRMAIIGGEQSLIPSVIETCGAKLHEDNPISVSRSQFSDEATEVFVLSA